MIDNNSSISKTYSKIVRLYRKLESFFQPYFDSELKEYLSGVAPWPDEQENQLDIHTTPKYAIAVPCGRIYRINSKFMDIAHLDQPKRHLRALGTLLTFLIFCLSVATFLFAITGGLGISFELITVLFGSVALIPFSWFLFVFRPLEFFTLKRCVIRFCRTNQKIYVAHSRHPRKIQVIDWSEKTLFCVRSSYEEEVVDPNPNSYSSTMKIIVPASLRCYRLGSHGEIDYGLILDKEEDEIDLTCRWEFYRNYMENGPENLNLPTAYWAENESWMDRVRFSLGERRGRWFYSICMTIGLVALFFTWVLSPEVSEYFYNMPEKDNRYDVAVFLSSFFLCVPTSILCVFVLCRALISLTGREIAWPDDVPLQPDFNDSYNHPGNEDAVGSPGFIETVKKYFSKVRNFWNDWDNWDYS